MKLFIDISNYVTTRAHTGIQRVVREFLYRLIKDNNSLDYVIIYYDTEEKKFIFLDDSEVLSFLKDTKYYIFKNTSSKLFISDIQEKDIFYDMDGAWGHSLKRTYLYKELKKQNVYIVNFIYDMVPIVKPEFAHENTVVNFTTFIYAVYTYSDLVLFDSRSAEKDFYNVQKTIQSSRKISTRVVKLGSDIQSNLHTNTKKYQKLLKSKYILFVGTLEPRKNQSLMLTVFERLNQNYPNLNLVFIGREGWNNHTLVEKIRTHKLLSKNIFWLENVNDAELFEFYENAYLCTYLSAYEGFGLPIAESLSHAKLTITSNNSSMYEVGKNSADYLTYNSFNELYETIKMYLEDQNLYTAKIQFIKENYTPYTWDLMYHSTIGILNSVHNYKLVVTKEKLQFVIISIDIDNLVGTLRDIDKYIHFVKEYIIVTSRDLVDAFKSLKSKHKIIVIDENDILQEHHIGFKERDHQSKNWLLRASLLKLDNLDEQFIMLDDDNRPLKNISIDHFIVEGKYNAYYYYDLLEWFNFQTEYDAGQHNMKDILDKDGYELLSYSSHKPQIIDKKIFQEVVNIYFEIGLKTPIDEWSIYFNYGVSHYPFLFNKLPYDTLNWPGVPSHWDARYISDNYNFENFYSFVYKDGVFKGMQNASYKDKILVKEKQLSPYLANNKKNLELSSYYTNYNLVHGIMSFKILDREVYLLNMPYYFEAKVNAYLKVGLNYKALQCATSDVQLMYFINGHKGMYTSLPAKNSYEDNRINFSISSVGLSIGEYDLLIDIVIDGKATFGTKSPYLVKLKITREKQ